jgi:Protein of unknown function (DUF3696)/AAA ATPase domain
LISFEFRWRNFRGFQDTGWISVRPITILVGSNNTGKSTLIAPLLLLKQTLRSRASEVPLVTRGDLANVGSFRDFVFHHDVSRRVSFDIRWHSHPTEEANEPLGRYPPGEVRVEFGLVEGDVVLSRFEVYDTFRRRYLTRTRTKSGHYTLSGLTEAAAPSGKRRMRSSDTAARRELPSHFLFDGDAPFYAQLMTGPPRKSEPDQDEPRETPRRMELSDWAREYWQVAAYVTFTMNTLLSQTSYLGPLREPLRRVYELAGDPPQDVGTRGEHAPEVLFRNEMLLEETHRWLRFFGLGRSLRTAASREDAFSLYFPAGGGRPSINLADVGFGASQILPMIVQGVAAGEDEMLAMEQPEIHLNPRLQSRIADFLGFMANSKKGVLVETHSEHLLLRLRTLMAKGDVDKDDVALYFVERQKDTSVIRPIEIGDNGHIEPSAWPRGFFQDSVREALALATEQNKRARGVS